jgi:hypothetical protein
LRKYHCLLFDMMYFCISLGFVPSLRNNPVFNYQDQTNPLQSKVGGKVLPNVGFSKFLSSGGKRERSAQSR